MPIDGAVGTETQPRAISILIRIEQDIRAVIFVVASVSQCFRSCRLGGADLTLEHICMAVAQVYWVVRISPN